MYAQEAIEQLELLAKAGDRVEILVKGFSRSDVMTAEGGLVFVRTFEKIAEEQKWSAPEYFLTRNDDLIGR